MQQPTRLKPVTRLAAATLITLGTLACSALYAQTGAFTLGSPDLSSGSFDNKFVLNGFGCKGDNVSPALEWKNVPPGTKSLSLLVHDPDAPTGSGFWHWTVLNMPASTTGLPQGAGNSPATLPTPAFGGNTDFMDTGATGANGNYGGPCPPTGDAPHHYHFTLYAVGVEDVQKAAGVPKTGSAALYSFVLNKGIGPGLLGTATFTATYGR